MFDVRKSVQIKYMDTWNAAIPGILCYALHEEMLEKSRKLKEKEKDTQVDLLE